METHQGQLLGRTGGSVCENTLSSSDKPVLSAHGSSSQTHEDWKHGVNASAALELELSLED